MIEILHSFGAGIAFVAGVFIGAFFARIAQKEGRREVIEASEKWKAHHIQVEERLAIYAANSSRIADSLEKMEANWRKISQ